MRVVWAPDALKDYHELKNAAPAIADKIDRLIEDIRRQPFRHRQTGAFDGRIRRLVVTSD